MGKRLFDKKIRIYGVPKDLRFTLFNMLEHLKKGGIVSIKFNGDGTVFEARKEKLHGSTSNSTIK